MKIAAVQAVLPAGRETPIVRVGESGLYWPKDLKERPSFVDQLKITGTVDQLLEIQTGTSQRGEWRKQDFILEIPGEYPRKVCVTVWGDNIDRFGLSKGDQVTAFIDLQSREYNGRWYTDVKAWKVERAEGGADPMPEPLPPLPESSAMDDDLPF